MSYDESVFASEWTTSQTIAIGVPILAVISLPFAPLVKIIWNSLPFVGKITWKRAWVATVITVAVFLTGAEYGAMEERRKGMTLYGASR